jgi:hypothetical protein
MHVNHFHGGNMPNFRLLATGVALSAAISGTVMLPATSASAATPACTKRVLFGLYSSGFAHVPMNSSETTTRCSLKKGNNNPAVHALQEMINECYVRTHDISHARLTEDSDFGQNTYDALRQVQAVIHAGVDGQYGPETASKIEAQAANGSCDNFPAS